MNVTYKEPGRELHIAKLPLEMGFFTAGCTVKVHLKIRGLKRIPPQHPFCLWDPAQSIWHASSANMAKGRQKSNHRWQREKIFPTHPLEVGVQLKSAMKYYAMTVFQTEFHKKDTW